MFPYRIIGNNKEIRNFLHKTETAAINKLIQETMWSYSIKPCK